MPHWLVLVTDQLVAVDGVMLCRLLAPLYAGRLYHSTTH
jgi:hypothetical protein